MARILRHKPETIGITLDEHGWANVDALIEGVNKKHPTARNVGQRHGKPVIYTVKSGEMYRDGIAFYRSVNGVWLTKAVPVKYLERGIV